ncbi:putative ubiquitin carboxyl-terminal hydrolase isozyme L3 [Aspergillus steynii IBT 23096]|uniref:Ubiquitin carboxyl-terminal hydrolase n=1 Tax=Aspergillus steynii IBT 23096 TaxID=1392250 RepID=A0A2I2G6B0_9EURO|nr:putative ubiquitin carboxyl-terminal hydrolase isozyme L3 [Aspergillus steynii IBT 23096]PLB48414.1 putative ubiquitin carboxyl-terminal hydrolase isozyme L3 [Aspergillus steynii IBT 23096]
MPSGVEIINGKKTFIPIENNPDVHSQLSRNLGIPTALTFHDIFDLNIDNDASQSSIPRPMNALILLCAPPIFDPVRSHTKSTIPTYTGSGPSEPIIWMKQTIGNACGLMALLHCIFNLEDGKYITPGSKLDELRRTAIALPPKERSQVLYDSQFLEDAHMDAAVRGSSTVPSAAEHAAGHFIAFVKDVRGKVWELNGSLPGPLERGDLGPGDDLLSPEGVKLTVGEFVDVAKTVDGGWGISIVGLGVGVGVAPS